jgi:hypothetical protein
MPVYYHAPAAFQEISLTRTIPTLAGTCLLVAGLAATALPNSAAAASRPQLKLATKTLAITKTSKLTGSHLHPKQVYVLLLAQPDLSHKKISGLIGGGMTDARGNLTVKVKAPPATACGKATVYAYTPKKSSKLIALKVKVSGCKAPSAASIPPPPPPARPTATPKP